MADVWVTIDAPVHVHGDEARLKLDELMAYLARAEARGRAAERERCAGMVREMAEHCTGLPTESLNRHSIVYDLRDLAERIGKGEP